MNLPREPHSTAFVTFPIDELIIDDEASFHHVALYAQLKKVLRAGKYEFRVLPPRLAGQWQRALFLNLTFWQVGAGGDVLADRHLPADVLAHVAWHHLAGRELAGDRSAPPDAEAIFLAEAVASAFDLYLIGMLLGRSPDSSFLETQVPAMAEVAMAAGLSDADFESLLTSVAAEPKRAFADLRELLFDAASALLGCGSADEALAALAHFDGHRFASLLHHYEISNWILYAQAHGRRSNSLYDRVHAVDAAMRAAPSALDWLVDEWVVPALDVAARSMN